MLPDDRSEGKALFCLPRRGFVLVLAGAIWLYGLWGIVDTFLLQHLPGEQGAAAWSSQVSCSGPKCQDVITCTGTRPASFHFREVSLLIGHSFFGYWGILGVWHGYPTDLLWFGSYLSFLPLFLIGICLSDATYTLICGEYSLNVIDEALLWAFPNQPVQEAVKLELRDAMTTYPVHFVNALVHRNVFFSYIMVEAVSILLLYYAAGQVVAHAQFVSNGALGFGSNYDLGDWHERLTLRAHRKSLAESYNYSSTAPSHLPLDRRGLSVVGGGNGKEALRSHLPVDRGTMMTSGGGGGGGSELP